MARFGKGMVLHGRNNAFIYSRVHGRTRDGVVALGALGFPSARSGYDLRESSSLQKTCLLYLLCLVGSTCRLLEGLEITSKELVYIPLKRNDLNLPNLLPKGEIDRQKEKEKKIRESRLITQFKILLLLVSCISLFIRPQILDTSNLEQNTLV